MSKVKVEQGSIDPKVLNIMKNEEIMAVLDTTLSQQHYIDARRIEHNLIEFNRKAAEKGIPPRATKGKWGGRKL